MPQGNLENVSTLHSVTTDKITELQCTSSRDIVACTKTFTSFANESLKIERTAFPKNDFSNSTSKIVFEINIYNKENKIYNSESETYM